MADSNLGLQLQITADNQAGPSLQQLQEQIIALQKEIEALKAKNDELAESQPGIWSNLGNIIWKWITSIAAAKVALQDFGKMSDEQFLDYAESALNAAQATGKVVDAAIPAEAANRKLSASYDELVKKVQANNLEFDALTQRAQQAQQQQEQLTKLNQSGVEVANSYTAALAAQSTVFGSTTAIAAALIAQRQRELDTARQSLDAKQEELRVNDEQLQQITQLVLSGAKLSEEQQRQFDSLRAQNLLKQDAALIAANHVQQLNAELNSAQGVRTAMAALSSQVEEQIKSSTEELEAEKKALEAKKDEAEARLQLITLRKTELAANAQAAEQEAAQADAAQQRAVALDAQTQAIESNTQATQANTEAETEDNDEEERGQQLDQQAVVTQEADTVALGENTDAQNAQATAAAHRAEATRLAQMQQAIENETETLSTAIKQKDIELADRQADAARAKRDAAMNYVAALRAQIEANPQATAADQNALRIAEQVAKTYDQEALAAYRTAQAKRDLAEMGETTSQKEVTAAERLVKATEAAMKAIDDRTKSMLAVNAIQTTLAINEGRWADAAQLSAQREALLATSQQDRVGQLTKEIGAQETYIDKLTHYAEVVDGEVHTADQGLIDAAQEKLRAMQLELQQLQFNQTAQQNQIDVTINLVKHRTAEAQAALALAQATGDEAGARKQVVAIAVDQARQAQLSAEKKQIELQATIATVQSIQQEIAKRQATGEIITEIDRSRLKAATNAMNSAAIEANAANLVAQAEEKKADVQTKMAQGLSELIRLRNLSATQATAETQAIATSADAIVRENQALLKLAQAKGDQQEIDRRQADLDRANTEAAYARASAAGATAQALSDQASNLALTALADGKYTLEEATAVDAAEARANAAQATATSLLNEAQASEEAQAAAKEKANADQEAAAAEKEHQQQLKAMTDGINNIMSGWSQRLNDLNPAIAKSFNYWVAGAQDATAGLSDLDVKIQQHEQLGQQLGALGASDSGMISYLNRVARKAYELEDAWVHQQTAAEDLIARLEKVGTGAAGGEEAVTRLIRQAQDAAKNFTLLDSTRLGNLKSAIVAANASLRKMQEETQTAKEHLQELNAELLSAQGQDQKAKLLTQELDYEKQLAEIEAKRTEAEAAGNRELVRILDQQKAVLEQINGAKVAAIESDAQSSDSQVTAAQKVQNAWTGVSETVAQARQQIQGLGQADLSGLAKQMAAIHQSAQGLAETL